MKLILTYISTCFYYLVLAQGPTDTTYLSPIYLDEVVVLDKQLPTKKLGYLKKENFTFSLYKDYEIGTFIKNTDGLNTIVDLQLKVNNEIKEEFEIEINFYAFNEKPKQLIRSIYARVVPTNNGKLIISHGGDIDMKFPKDGIFISTKIKSNLTRENARHFRVYLSQKYQSKSTFIRGAIYGDQWIEMSELNLRKGKVINVCYGILAY